MGAGGAQAVLDDQGEAFHHRPGDVLTLVFQGQPEQGAAGQRVQERGPFPGRGQVRLEHQAPGAGFGLGGQLAQFRRAGQAEQPACPLGDLAAGEGGEGPQVLPGDAQGDGQPGGFLTEAGPGR